MSADLKAYARECERHPELAALVCSDAWVTRAIKKLCRHFKLTMPKVTLRTRGTWSHGGYGGVDFCPSPSWLTVIHEFAHEWDCQRTNRWAGIKSFHCKRHDRLVDRAARYVTRKGWPQADLDGQFAAFCQAQALEESPTAVPIDAKAGVIEIRGDWVNDETAAAVAESLQPGWERKAASADRAKRIEQRRAQVARLERKIKGLTTRLKRARRSLNALERVAKHHSAD